MSLNYQIPTMIRDKWIRINEINIRDITYINIIENQSVHCLAARLIKMQNARVFVLFSLIVLCKSASFEKHARYDPSSASYEPRSLYEAENESYRRKSLDDGAGNESYEPRSLDDGAGYASYEPSSEVTAFGYHMKVGVPRVMELLKAEGLQTRIVGGSQVASASINPHQVSI